MAAFGGGLCRRGATALWAEEGGIALRAMSFKISLREMENQTTGLRPLEMHPYPRLRRYFPRRGKFALLSAFGLIQYEQHFGELATSGGFFPLWCLRHHLPPAKAVGQQPVLCLEQHLKQQSRGALLCPRSRGKGGGASHQRGVRISLARRAVVWFSLFPRAKPGCKGFIQTGAFYYFKGAHHNPQRRSRCQT